MVDPAGRSEKVDPGRSIRVGRSGPACSGLGHPPPKRISLYAAALETTVSFHIFYYACGHPVTCAVRCYCTKNATQSGSGFNY